MNMLLEDGSNEKMAKPASQEKDKSQEVYVKPFDQ